eukprot:XP_001690836.1 predicted protein [Chlamydomonas reinhardtii]
MAPTAGHQHASQVEIPTFSIALPEKLTPDGPWSVYRSATSPFQLVSTYPPPADHVRTLHDNLEYAASKFPHIPYLGWRKRDDKGRLGAYTWMTYAQASDVRTALGSGLMQLGLQPKSAVGIYSVNCKEWLLYDYALHAYGMVSVPLYDTLGPDAVEFIANHAELAAVGVSAAVLPTMLTVLHRCPTVRLLVVWGASGPLPDPPAGASHCRLMTLEALTYLGAAVGFYSGNVQELLEDVTVLKPQIFASVPRLWNRIYDRVMLAVQTGSPLARGLFERAYAHKRACLAKGDPVGGRWGRLYDRLVFSKIRAKLGGELKYMISGHVGAPNPAVEIKLVDIPEMGYTARDSPYPRGEICVRGPSVFAGYYKDEAQTRDVLDGDGWLHTGDVGAWLEGGRLKIIDRKKNIFKLAQGEYIAPEKIENTYTRSPMVLQVFVYGDSLRSQLVLVPWAKERGIAGSLPELCANPHVRDAVLKSMQEQAREAQLRGFEQVHTIHLFPEPFSVENDMLTPTFKLKRPQAKARFQEELDAMYAAMPATH